MKMRFAIVALAGTLLAGVIGTPSALAAAPVNTSQPTIVGTPEQGKTLTATNGTWSNTPTSFSYQWQRCNADGSSCVDIATATKKAYLLVAADVDHSVRVVVTATNASGHNMANSKPTNVISSNTAPRNTARPTISGTPQVGEVLTADPGTWTGGVSSFAYQWQRCEPNGTNCIDIDGATGKTYGVRTLDVGFTLRVKVTATNLAGTQAETSDRSDPVKAIPTPAPTPTNHRPTIRILSTHFVGARLYVVFRVCDDSHGNLNVTERDSKTGVPSYTRHFATLVPPNPCASLRRNWLPALRFRHGRYVVSMWARDKSGLTSLTARRTFFR
jgi:hypothetical protein